MGCRRNVASGSQAIADSRPLQQRDQSNVHASEVYRKRPPTCQRALPVHFCQGHLLRHFVQTADSVCLQNSVFLQISCLSFELLEYGQHGI